MLCVCQTIYFVKTVGLKFSLILIKKTQNIMVNVKLYSMILLTH